MRIGGPPAAEGQEAAGITPADLRARIDRATDRLVFMTTVNARLRENRRGGLKAQIRALVALGLEEKLARTIAEPNGAGRVGFAGYEVKTQRRHIDRLRVDLANTMEAQRRG